MMMIYYLIQQVFTLFQSISLLEGQAEVELKLRKKKIAQVDLLWHYG